jgi:PAS domain-containing protein
VIWDRRNEDEPEGRAAPRDPFGALLEHAPVMALLLDAEGRVVAANQSARTFFEIEQDRLPASVVEVTLEASLLEVLGGSAWPRCARSSSPTSSTS